MFNTLQLSVGAERENQKQRFISWFKQQPQRNNPSKKYADSTVMAAVGYLQNGLKNLGIPGYENTDCFAITDSEEFQKLHEACYDAATVFDKKNGFGDFRNGLDFYLYFLLEDEKHRAAARDKIRYVISHYKANFDTVTEGELYKWQAIAHYKKHWDIGAPNFAEMLKNAFAKAYNLLTSGQYYPYKMLLEFAQKDPETVQAVFRLLYNEDIPLEDRYQAFRHAFDGYIEERKQSQPDPTKPLNHYQDLRAVMVYLTFEYPEKYYFFKASMYTTFRDRIGYREPIALGQPIMQKLANYLGMSELVLSEVRKDTELLSMHKSRLSEGCYLDENLHLLTMDIIYYGSNYMSAALFQPNNSYWPSPADYHPGITEEMWISLLQDESVTTPESRQLLDMFMKFGGETSFGNLTARFGSQFDYKETLQDFSKRVAGAVNCAKFPKGYKEFEAYIIPLVGHTVIEGGTNKTFWKLRDELYAALLNIDHTGTSAHVTEKEDSMTDISLNTILYGPPGTGKTYHTVIYAVAIVENKTLEEVKSEDYTAVLARYHEHKAQGRIEFTTFHQSYGYEEFIEGIRPVVADDDEEDVSGDIRYSVQPGAFKKFCDRADRPAAQDTGDLGIRDNAVIWKVSLWGTGDNEVRTECLQNGHIRIAWDLYGKEITDKTDFSAEGGRVVLNAFINKMQVGDIVFSCYSASTIDAIGVVTGEYEWHDEYEHCRRVRKVNWFVKNIRENILSINGGTAMTLASVYRLSNIEISDVYNIIKKHLPTNQSVASKKDNHVFIIDEINRGNISKIFGELITLIEDTKRTGGAEEMKTLLPYSQKPFGVPNNVYIIGTMNTADRSIATIDTALRRRFAFKEMLPDADVLSGISVGKLSVKELLSRMNERISVLYDREHTIGHAYFLPLKKNNSMEMLADIFKNKVIPLLQEYFYEDYEKIRLVLGDNQKKDENAQFILAKKINQSDLFGNSDVGLDDGYTYEINANAFMNPEAYLLK